MIGNALLEVLSERGIDAIATTRSVSLLPAERRSGFVEFDVVSDDPATLLSDFGPGDYVVNCTGVIKQNIDDANAAHRRNAIAINAEFPYALAALAEEQGFRVVHIATDCVYSGRDGDYSESALHDCTDVYGKTKSLGEVPSDSVVNIRCSMIGRELKGRASLLEWVLDHPAGSTFGGYTDHIWNGVTARGFGRVVAGIIETANPISGTHHLVPADRVTKHELSQLILDAYGRGDVTVEPVVTGKPVDRTLATTEPQTSAALWRDAGFSEPPRIANLVADLVRGPSLSTLG